MTPGGTGVSHATPPTWQGRGLSTLCLRYGFDKGAKHRATANSSLLFFSSPSAGSASDGQAGARKVFTRFPVSCCPGLTFPAFLFFFIIPRGCTRDLLLGAEAWQGTSSGGAQERRRAGRGVCCCSSIGARALAALWQAKCSLNNVQRHRQAAPLSGEPDAPVRRGGTVRGGRRRSQAQPGKPHLA